MLVELSAWLWSMDISNVCPKAMPDFCPSVLLADIQIPICGKGFWMPVKCCLNYYHEIFRDHIFFCVWNCMTLSDNRFLDLSWMCGKGHYYIEKSSACATGITNNTLCNLWQMHGCPKPFFFHQCIYRILKCNRCQRLYFTSSDQQCYKIYYTPVHWFLTGSRWQLW